MRSEQRLKFVKRNVIKQYSTSLREILCLMKYLKAILTTANGETLVKHHIALNEVL